MRRPLPAQHQTMARLPPEQRAGPTAPRTRPVRPMPLPPKGWLRRGGGLGHGEELAHPAQRRRRRPRQTRRPP
eukprot:6954651-Lingulodinium_polyedra.AAC.1